MKKHKLIFLFAILTFISKSQDQLFKKDNTKILVKIIEIGPEELKYKLHDNLNGPTYVVAKSEVSLIIYESGQHEVIKSEAVVTPSRPMRENTPYSMVSSMSKSDSLKYYKYSESVSINFLSFLNMEVGIIYQKEFFKSNFSVIIPLGIGLEKPGVTQSVYFNPTISGNQYNYNGYYNSNSYTLNKKQFEVGFGLNYYPTLKNPVNYFVGPTFRYMQYTGTQTYVYRMNNPIGQNITLTKNSNLSRYCISITNGLIFRTRSRLVFSMFGSIGFKNDVVSDAIVDPNTKTEVNPLKNPFGIYWWSGFNLGFCF
jgi:hypothetical protein